MNLIKDKVDTCNHAAEGISFAVEELAKGTMDMAESVQNTALHMQEIGDNITEITRLASDASAAVRSESSEAGRGFAVAAGEISNLATQSDASTQEIQAVVTEIIKTSEHNISLANKIKMAVDNEGTVYLR